MAHPLEKKVADLGRQVRRLLALYGIGRVVSAVAGTLLLLGSADYLIHFEDRGIRAMASLAVLAVFAWSAYRYLFVLLSHRAGDVQIAQRIERRFPQLKDQLSSSVQFLKQSEADPQAGSAALRRAVIGETTARLERLNLGETIERRPARWAAGIALAVCLVAALLAICDPTSAQLALVRLARPFGGDAWPKFNDLTFRHPPDRIALGKPFEVELVDRNHRMPDEVRIHYRFEGDGQNVEETVEPMHLLNGVMTARKDAVTRPFKFRAEGGDDRSMQWHALDVVEPPRVESLKITLYPPEYTGWPAEPSEKQIHALRGTRVQLTGAANKPLASAALVQDGALQEGAATVPAALVDNKYGFSVPGDPAEPFIIDKAGTYAFDLKDTEGVSGGADDRWEIRAVPDQPPTVSIEQPGANVFVTRDAVVPLRINVKDDLAVHEVMLHYNRSDRTDVEDFQVALFTGPEKVAPSKTGLSGLAGDSRVVEHDWELAPLDLKPGTQLAFFAAAADYLPQIGRSPARRLTIISRRELEERIGQRQAVILGELRRVLKMQQEARAQVSSLEIQVSEVGRFGKPDVDHAQGAELNQRQVARTLTSNTEGIPAQIKDLLAELASNKVDSPEVGRRMTSILDEVDRLEKQHLNAIERDLTSAIKGAQAKLGDQEPEKKTSTDHQEFSRSLASAGGHQDQVIQSLETMLGELTEWDGYRRFGQDVAQIRHDEDEIQQHTKQLGAQTLGKEFKDLDAQQQADLKKLAHRQSELARRFDKLQQEMGQMTARLKTNDPLSAATLSEAVEQALREGISGDMRQSASHAEKNQVSQAMQRQDQVNRNLDELLDILSNRREHELGRLVKKLREAERQLAELRSRQEGLRKKMAAAAKIADREERRRELESLSKREKQLQQESQNFAHRLQRLQAEKAGRTMAGAAGKMGRAGQAADKGDADRSEDQADQAKKDLDDAQQQLAERRKQAEADLAQEQLARIEDGLKSLHKRQQNVLDETERLENLRDAQRQFKREQAAAVQQQAREQKSLEQEVSFLAEKIAAAEVFHRALSSTGKQMGLAGDLLARADTGEATQRAEENAEAGLTRLLEALKQEQKPGPAKEGGGGGGGGKSGQKNPGIQALAEVKLLKLLQQDLNQRFQELAEKSADESAEAYAELGREQGELAELLAKLSQPEEPAPEDNPDKLPVIRGKDPLLDDLKLDKPPSDKNPVPPADADDVPQISPPGADTDE